MAEIGDLIASRELTLVRGDGAERKILVEIGRPSQISVEGDHTCPFRIRGVGPGTIMYIYGIDGIQALQLAQGAIGATLRYWARYHGAEIHWLGEPGSIGFPDTAEDEPR